jgi:hypothetical protein
LLPYSWYNIEVAAYTVEYGRAENVTARTMELGKLFLHMWYCRKRDVQTDCGCIDIINSS